MEDKQTTDFFVNICKDEDEKDILSMLLSGMSCEEIIEKYLEKQGNHDND